MKSLIKLSIFTLLITAVSGSFAQTIGIKAGLNLSNMLVKESEVLLPYDTYDENLKMDPGFHLGAIAEFPMFDLFSFEAGLLLSAKGFRNVEKETFLVTKEIHNLFYLDIPLAAKVPFSVGRFDFYGSFGSYGGIGLYGVTKTKDTFGGMVETEKDNIEWGSDEGVDDFKRFDYGLTFGAGVELKSFQLGLYYNLGLANISPNSDLGSKMSNRILGISVGYMFGENRKFGSARPMAEKGKEERVKDTPVKEEKKVDTSAKSKKSPVVKSSGRKAAEIEAERLRMEKIRADSIEAARVMAEKIQAERISLERIKADSIAAARKAASIKTTKDLVIYRVQFLSNTSKKGSYDITIGGKNYRTWEYFYNGAYRSTVGEFKTYAAALEGFSGVRTNF